VPIRAVFAAPSVAELASYLETGDGSGHTSDPFAPVLPIRTGGPAAEKPLWFVHSGGGTCWPYLGFAARLPRDREIFGIQAKGFHPGTALPASLDEVVTDYVAELLAMQPEGPYHLIGYSIGGTIAHAMAAELRRLGHEVALLAMLDSAPSSHLASQSPPSAAEFREYFHDHLTSVAGVDDKESFVENAVSVILNHTALTADFTSPVFDGDVLFFRAVPAAQPSYTELWRPHIRGGIRAYDIATTHADMYLPGPAAEICRVISGELAAGTGETDEGVSA
jgi:thioesterase domain-containing protein